MAVLWRQLKTCCDWCKCECLLACKQKITHPQYKVPKPTQKNEVMGCKKWITFYELSSFVNWQEDNSTESLAIVDKVRSAIYLRHQSNTFHTFIRSHRNETRCLCEWQPKMNGNYIQKKIQYNNINLVFVSPLAYVRYTPIQRTHTPKQMNNAQIKWNIFGCEINAGEIVADEM